MTRNDETQKKERKRTEMNTIEWIQLSLVCLNFGRDKSRIEGERKEQKEKKRNGEKER